MNRLNRLLLSGTLGFGAVGGGLFAGNVLLAEKEPSIASAEACLESIGEDELGVTVSQEDLSPSCKQVSKLITSQTVTIQSVTSSGELDTEEEIKYILPETPNEFINSVNAFVENENATDRKLAIGLTGLFVPMLTTMFYRDFFLEHKKDAKNGQTWCLSRKKQKFSNFRHNTLIKSKD